MKTFFAFVPVGLWSVLILILSAVSGLRPPPIRVGFIGPDKIAHIGVYAIFALLLWLGFFLSGRHSKESLFILLGGSAYGFGMEIMQFAFFPNRMFEIWDILANICGITAGWSAGYLYSKFVKSSAWTYH